MSQTDWIPGLVAVGCGAALGLAVLVVAWRRKQGASAGPRRDNDALADLDSRVQLRVEELKALALERLEMGEDAYARERARLEQSAADAMRERDTLVGGAAAVPARTTDKPVPASVTGFWGSNPQLKGALWGGGTVLFFVALGWVLTQQEKPRVDGQAPTGRAPMTQAPTTAPQPPGEDGDFKEALAHATQHPEDLDASARVGHELIRLQRFDEAEHITEQALGVDPFHFESRVHRAVLKTTRGQTQQAVEELEHLAVTFPHSEEARLFLGGLRMELGDRAGALAALERYMADTPPDEQPPQLAPLVAQLRSEMK